MRPTPTHLSELPLWRLIVALDDAERTVGTDSPTARVLARAIQDRLRTQRGDRHLTREEACRE
jgi:hypothetical protein